MKVYIWGTGCAAGELVDSGIDTSQLAAFIDNDPPSESFCGKPVIKPAELAGKEYDLIIITPRSAGAIAEQSRELGLDADRLFFLKNNMLLSDRNSCYDKAEAYLGRKTVDELRQSCHVVRGAMRSSESRLSAGDTENDYVRLSTLETVCLELDGVPGAAAELGVYKGAFARCINKLMPERTLYLFDTFEGFDSAEASRELQADNCGEAFVAAHRNTAAEAVRSSMPHPESTVIMQGLFPGSLNGLEERFAFVSIDADFEESVFEGLKYFVPRMNEGGYIFLHDYNSHELTGVRKAVKRYGALTGKRLKAVPLCDVNGTLAMPF